MSINFDGWPHVICAQQFSRRWLEEEFFPHVDRMGEVMRFGGCDSLVDKRAVSIFYTPSLRTQAGLAIALRNLGGEVVFQSENARQFSSVYTGRRFFSAKPLTREDVAEQDIRDLQDTIAVLNRYRPDVIFLRFDREIGSEFAAKVSKVPIINAGDREPGQHPTQALASIRTIYKRFGKIDGLRIAMVGDMMNGRTARSLCYLLGKFKTEHIDLVAPKPLRMKDDVKDYLKRHGVKFFESEDLRVMAPHVDVIYQTQAQIDCGAAFDMQNHDLGHFIVDQEIIGLMKPSAIVMHPLPRGPEIAPCVDHDPRAVYLTSEVDSVLLTNMALLEMVLAP